MSAAFGKITAAADVIYPRYDPKNFVGRAWLRDQVSQFCARADGRHLILVGEPGSGKTSFLAYVAETQNCPRHFIRVDHTGGVIGVSPRAFLISLGAQLYEKYGPDIFERAAAGSTEVQAGLTKDDAIVVGRFVDELFTLPFLPARVHDVKVKALAAMGRSQVIGERVGRLVDVTAALDELTLLHAVLLNPLKKLQTLHPGEKVLIVIDSLDEAEQHTGMQIPDVIPLAADAEFPPNLRLLMSSRPGNHLLKFRSEDMLQFEGGEGGYRALSRQDIQKFIRHDIEDLIRQRLSEDPWRPVTAGWPAMGVEQYQAKVADAADGNYLYLHHFFKQAEETIQSGETTPETIAIPKDLDDIYRTFAVNRIKGSTGLRDWVELYLPLLGALAVIQEAVGRELLAGFAGVPVEYADYIIRQLAQFLDRIPAAEGDRWRLYHRSFGEYLLDAQRNRDYPLEAGKYHGRVADFYRDGHAHWSEAQWAPDQHVYAFRHLASHLRAAGRQESLFELLMADNWYKAQIARDTTGAGFLADLAEGISAAEAINRKAIRDQQPAPLLGYEVRMALSMSTLHGLSEQIPVELLSELVEQGLWSIEQALAAARRNPDPARRAGALLMLAALDEAESESTLREALLSVQTLDSAGWQRLDILQRLLPRLPGSLVQTALAVSRKIRDPQERAAELARLVPFLPPARQGKEAQTAIRLLTRAEWDTGRVSIWQSMVEAWPEPLKSQVLDIALEDIRALPQGDEWRARSLAILAEKITGQMRENLLQEAFEATLAIAEEPAPSRPDSMQWSQGQTMAFGDLIPQLSGRLLRQALAVAEKIHASGDRSAVLRDCVESLAREGDLQEALRVAKAIQADGDRVQALAEIAPFLTQTRDIEAALLLIPDRKGEPHPWPSAALSVRLAEVGHYQEALAKARTIVSSPSHRLHALAGLAAKMLAPVATELIQEVLEVARLPAVQRNLAQSLEEVEEQPLMALAVRLAGEGRVDEALACARSFPNFGIEGGAGPRVQALTLLAGHLEESTRGDTLREALAAAHAVADARNRVTIVTSLFGQSSTLPPGEIEPVLESTLAVVPFIGKDDEQAEALGQLAAFLTPPMLGPALALARNIQVASHRIWALVQLAKRLSAPLKDEVLQEAMELSETVHWFPMNLHTLTVLIANLPEARQREALERAVTAHWTRLLVALVPRLPDSLQREAIAGLQAIKDPAERIPALSHVAGQWPEASRRETLTAVGRLKDDSDRSQSLIDLAPWLPDSALEQAVSLAQGLSEDYERAEALDALLPRWAAAGHAQEALECLEQIDWSQGELVGRQRSLRAEILAASLPHLPDSDRSAILPGALRSIRKLENRYMFACAAKDLAPLLPEPLSTNLIEEAFRAVLDDQDWEDRASALQELAPCLPVSLLADATSAASQLPGTPYLNESPRAGALAALATRLAALPPTGLYSIWHDTLLRLSRSARPDLLWDLPALCTVMTALGCANAPVEVARTITEVATRWP